MFEHDAMPAFAPRFFTVVDSVRGDSNAEKGGLLKGDSLISVNGVPTKFFDEFRAELQDHKDEEVVVGFYREGKRMEKSIATDTAGSLGFYPKDWRAFYQFQHKDYSFGECIGGGFSLGMTTLSDYIAQLKFLFTSKGASSIGGFGAFGSLFSPYWDWHRFWMMTAFISIMLAFLNFLPIPALDGGHIMFLLYEMVSGRKPGDKFLQYAQVVGFVLLLGLILYANGNDIYKAIVGD
jgi:regulator of sigma E protease